MHCEVQSLLDLVWNLLPFIFLQSKKGVALYECLIKTFVSVTQVWQLRVIETISRVFQLKLV